MQREQSTPTYLLVPAPLLTSRATSSLPPNHMDPREILQALPASRSPCSVWHGVIVLQHLASGWTAHPVTIAHDYAEQLPSRISGTHRPRNSHCFPIQCCTCYSSACSKRTPSPTTAAPPLLIPGSHCGLVTIPPCAQDLEQTRYVSNQHGQSRRSLSKWHETNARKLPKRMSLLLLRCAAGEAGAPAHCPNLRNVTFR